MVHLRQACIDYEKEEKGDTTIVGETGLKGKRSKLLGTFKGRYGFLPSLENQPSEACIGLLLKMHSGKSTEFFPLSRVSNYADGRDLKIEPRKNQRGALPNGC